MGQVKQNVFFNHGAVGLMGKPAYGAASQFLTEYFKVGPPLVLFKYEPYVAMLKHEVATLLHCEQEEVTYIKNTSEGIIIASEALPLAPGDEVLLGGNEYPANLLPWLKKKKDGISVRTIEGADNKQVFESLYESISPRTKVIAISWAQHYDGYFPDLAKFGKICREKGIFFIVDAVQGIGVRSLDLQKTPVDMLICGGQKHLGAIMGIGFMYVNKKIISKLKDTKVGIRGMKRFDNQSYVLKDTAERFEDGTQNLLGIVALHAAIKHINTVGMKTIEKKNATLLKAFKAHLTANNIPFIDHDVQGNSIALKIPDAVALCQSLRERGIYIKAVKDIARISFSNTSTLRDFKILVIAINELLLARRAQVFVSMPVTRKYA